MITNIKIYIGLIIITVQPNLHAVFLGIISSKKILDRESHAQFILTVTATDGGGLSCQAEVYVTLTDVNDNEPSFTQTQFTVSIPENAEINTLLTKVSASDEDLGRFCVTQYY